ncbi:MAG: carboxypeptidase regulatory-like domain-containing protein, partial [bacterium]|nr:carboxypeptidase regulatory-like domain-containing protein [bacterium]
MDHKIRLAKPVEFVGRVRTPSGGPVVGVEVKSTDGSGSFGGWGRTHDDSVEPFLAGSGVATTDEQGRFVLGGLSPASRSMHVAHEPFLGYHEYHHHDRGEIEIELVEGESIEGDVRGRIGEIIPGAQVAFWPHYAGSVTTPKWNSPDPETGHFAIRGIEPYESYGGSTPKMSGKNRGVIFRAPGYAVEVITPVPTDLSELTPLQVRMSPEKRIEGRAVDSNGNPKVGLRVRIEGDRTYESNMSDGFAHTWEKLIQKNITHTDEQGVFSFDQLYPGRFSVRVYSGSSEQGSIAKTTVSGGPPLEFVMDEQLIRGVVVLPTVADKLTGEPITNYTLLQWVGDTGYHRTVTEGVNGPEVAGLEPGRWGLGITADGYVSERLKDKTYALGEYPVEFQLAPVRSLEVKVLLPDGTSPPHVIVHGVDSDGSKLMFDQGGSSSTRTQLNSAVRHLHGLPARSVELTFGSDRFGATVSVDLQESWSKPLVVHLRAVGPPPQKPTLAYMAIWELKPLEAGEDAGLLPMSMPRVMRETQQSDIDTLIERVGRHRLISPIHPFAIVIDTPAGEESAGVRWEYISEEDAEVFTPHKEEEGPSRDRLKAKVEKALGPLAEQQGGPFLRLACNWRIGGRKSGSATVPRLAWSNSPRGIELKSGLALEPYFETRPGECSLRLTSDHYEPIELTWYPGQRKEG